jgi:putative hydrolase of the HAD superfamily
MQIKAVFFDAAGTLIKPVRNVGDSYAAFAAKYGKHIASQDIIGRFRDCFDSAPRLAFPGATQDTLSELERAWWKNLVAKVFEPWHPFDGFDDCFAELFAYFAEPKAWALYPDVLETLAVLKKRGLILDVISNFDSRLIGILDGLGAGLLFERVFVSSQVGYAKPDHRIFNTALDYHGLASTDALHVGDSETHDLRGATGAGIRAILVERQRKATAAPVADRIENLQSLPSLLQN